MRFRFDCDSKQTLSPISTKAETLGKLEQLNFAVIMHSNQVTLLFLLFDADEDQVYGDMDKVSLLHGSHALFMLGFKGLLLLFVDGVLLFHLLCVGLLFDLESSSGFYIGFLNLDGDGLTCSCTY